MQLHEQELEIQAPQGRNDLLSYLKKTSLERYRKTVSALNLRK